MVFGCFGGCGSLIPAEHTELTREQLKKLYLKSIAANDGRLIVHGIFARSDTRNNNKRVYPKHILKREVTRFEAEHILKGTALGELDHPNYASRYFKCLNLPNASHQVLEVQWKGGELWGSIEILPTPSGLLLWELYSQGIKLGVSSRGWASLRTDPHSKSVYVDDDFELITFDFVTEPSTHGAYLVPVKKRYNRSGIPDQRKVVAICHLGHGVVSMEKVSRLPDPKMLADRIADLQRSAAALLAGLPAPEPSPATALSPYKPSSLDNLLCYSHYLVHSDAPYLHQEQHARDYRAHLAIFATRAHLADQSHLLARSDIDRVVLDEIATKDAFDPASKSFATQLGCPRALNDSKERSPMANMLEDLYTAPLHNDLGSWKLHPNALTSPNSQPSSYREDATDGQLIQGQPGQLMQGQPGGVMGPAGQGLQAGQLGAWAQGEASSSGHAPLQALAAVPAPLLPPGRHPLPQHPQIQQVPGHLVAAIQQLPQPPGTQQQLDAQSGGPGGQQGKGRSDSWLGHVARDARVAQEFQRIRGTLVNYAQLYHVHQTQVERSLLAAAVLGVRG